MVSIASWTEGIILSLAFVAILTLVIASFNAMYGEDYDIGFNDSSGSEQLFVEYQDTAQAQISGGEAAFDATQGITLKSSWGLAKDAGNVVWSFITGGWIENIVNSWGVGTAGTILAKGIRLIYFISIVFALMYILFKVVL
jgi:hypothetical protein